MLHDRSKNGGGVATVACMIWVGSGHPQPLHRPGGCSPFIECLGKTIVGSKCLFCYTGSRQEVAQKYKETRVSKGF